MHANRLILLLSSLILPSHRRLSFSEKWNFPLDLACSLMQCITSDDVIFFDWIWIWKKYQKRDLFVRINKIFYKRFIKLWPRNHQCQRLWALFFIHQKSFAINFNFIDVSQFFYFCFTQTDENLYVIKYSFLLLYLTCNLYFCFLCKYSTI